jgi:hypothetical protein
MKEELKQHAICLNASKEVLNWIDKRVIEPINISEVEHIIDYLISNKAPKRLSRATYKQMKSNTDKWNKSLQKKGKAIKEDETKTILDFKDGFKIVKLIGENSYKREGNLMRHCAASCYGKDVEIYSLRDSKNMPHATMEKDQQIKGKGNGDIHPKYIDYIVKFLEWSGMEVRDSEMEHLGYIVPDFYEYVKNNLYKKKYLRKTEQVEYKDNVIILEDLEELKRYKGNKKCLFDGDIVIREDINIQNIVAISGSIEVNKNAELSLPNLKSSDYIEVNKNAKLSAPNLKSSDYIYVNKNAKLSAPNLKSSDHIYVNKNAKLSLPNLKSSGSIDVNKNSKLSLPNLKSSDYIYVRENAELSAPNLKSSDYIYVNKNTKLSLPNLKSSGSIDVRENAKLSLPNLKSSGYIFVNENAELSAPNYKY